MLATTSEHPNMSQSSDISCLIIELLIATGIGEYTRYRVLLNFEKKNIKNYTSKKQEEKTSILFSTHIIVDKSF